MSSTPKVLLATTSRWFSAARLAISFSRAGCRVEAVCPSRHPLMVTRATKRCYNFNPLSPVSSLRTAIEMSQPDFVLPCDDLAATHLRKLFADERHDPSPSTALLQLLRISLGDPTSHPVIESRSRFLALAEEAGITTPSTTEVLSKKQIVDWCQAHGLPAVLKADGSWGGQGVRVVHTQAEAVEAFRLLCAPVSIAYVVKRAVVDRDLNPLLPWIGRRRHAVSIQKFIEGTDFNIAIACWNGEVVASVGAEVLKKWYANGPASIIRFVPDGPMLDSAKVLAKSLNLTGLAGFDFLVDADGRFFLLEINPRATQTGHIPLGPSHDLASSLTTRLTGEERISVNVTSLTEIALFPLASREHGSLSFPPSVYLDIPVEEPRLVDAGDAESRLLSRGKWIRLWLKSWQRVETRPLESYFPPDPLS